MTDREKLLEKWASRDNRYALSRKQGLTDTELEAVRTWRLQEAGDDPSLRFLAETWVAPRPSIH